MDGFLHAMTSGVGEIVEILAISIPITLFMIPIVAIMTHHQRKMAEIIHGKAGQGLPAGVHEEIGSLREEVRQLRQLINQQVIALDSRPAPTNPPPLREANELQDRLKNS